METIPPGTEKKQETVSEEPKNRNGGVSSAS